MTARRSAGYAGTMPGGRGLLAARLRYNAFKLRRHRVVEPGIAVLGTDERRDLPDHYDAEFQVNRKGCGAWLLFAATPGTTPAVLVHGHFPKLIDAGMHVW
jgi:hypothetical protein